MNKNNKNGIEEIKETRRKGKRKTIVLNRRTKDTKRIKRTWIISNKWVLKIQKKIKS